MTDTMEKQLLYVFTVSAELLGCWNGYRTFSLMKRRGEDAFLLRDEGETSCEGSWCDDDDDDDFMTWERIVALAANNSDPRLPDVATESQHLLKLWAWVRAQTSAPDDEHATEECPPIG